MIEKASNLQDRHQEKSEETNVMWETEVKKTKLFLDNWGTVEKTWCYKKEQTEDSYEFLRIKTVIKEIFKELNRSRNIKGKMGKFFWKWDRGKRALEVKESCSLSQRPALSSFIRVLLEEWNGGKEISKEIARENFPKSKDLSVCSKRCH